MTSAPLVTLPNATRHGGKGLTEALRLPSPFQGEGVGG